MKRKSVKKGIAVALAATMTGGVLPPSLTVGKIKNGYKPSKHGLCSRFLFRNDMCYIMIFLI